MSYYGRYGADGHGGEVPAQNTVDNSSFGKPALRIMGGGGDKWLTGQQRPGSGTLSYGTVAGGERRDASDWQIPLPAAFWLVGVLLNPYVRGYIFRFLWLFVSKGVRPELYYLCSYVFDFILIVVVSWVVTCSARRYRGPAVWSLLAMALAAANIVFFIPTMMDAFQLYSHPFL